MFAPAPLRIARDVTYLVAGLATSVLAFGVWVAALTLSLTLAILIIGIPVIIGSAYVMRWTAELDRQNAALVFGRPVRGHYRTHRGRSLGSRVLNTLRDPQVWRDLAWLITHSVLGFAFGIAALSLLITTLGTAALPFWFWSVPDGVQMGLWNVDTLFEAVLTAWLAIPIAWIAVWLLRGMAKFHASLAVELLGRY
jgi:putative sensor protein